MNKETQLREALKKDFRRLYVRQYSTMWEMERTFREVEIDIMDLSETLALLKEEINEQAIH